MALQSIAGLEPGWQMAACLQGLDSYRASNTTNTDNWVEKDAARTQIFIVSLCVSLNWFHVFFHLASPSYALKEKRQILFYVILKEQIT